MFHSNRSPVICVNGCAASSQSVASQTGIDILRKGGNAADAAVAMAAVLNVAEPGSTGIGGDAFCLYYREKDKKIFGMNASGKSPHNLTLDLMHARGFNEDNKPLPESGLNVTVPGAVAGWVDCHSNYGSGEMKLKDILKPAISMARDGFVVSGPFTTHRWNIDTPRLLADVSQNGRDLLMKNIDGSYRAPATGEVMTNSHLANVFQSIADNGKDGFYKGWVADAIVDAISNAGGVLNKDDLQLHSNIFVEPLSVDYKDVTLWELPPNGQGMVALEMISILKNFDIGKMQHNSAEYLHTLIETTKICFKDSMAYCSDPECGCKHYVNVLNPNYAKTRASEINPHVANHEFKPGDLERFGHDTVYFTVVDSEGNACSFINSIFMSFGSSIFPKNCGFALQNRGAGFSLNPDSPNVVGPSKRPYHTIIPALLTEKNSGNLLMSFGVMGGFMQPQGHIQVLLNMVEYGMNPQEALDSPRYMVGDGYKGPDFGISLEDGISEEDVKKLKKMGHKDITWPVKDFDKMKFGKGQIIALKPFWKKNSKINSSGMKVLWAGSDPRSDGVAVGY